MNMNKSILFLVIITSVLVFTQACNEVAELPTQTQAAPKVEAAEENILESTNLSWDTEERKPWSTAVFESIDLHWDTLQTATDMKRVCENYDSFSESTKKKAWAELFVGMMLFESSWNPKLRFFETEMGYYSEGLFQLSVIDESWIKCGLTKTSILTPIVNIKCGVKVMARQVYKKKKVFLKEGVYWSVIRDRPDKLDRMKKQVNKAFTKCKGV